MFGTTEESGISSENNTNEISNSLNLSRYEHDYYGWPKWFYFAYVTYYLIAEYVSLLMQVIFVLTILRSFKMREKAHYYLLVNLAVSDIIWCSVITSISTTTYFTGRWYFGDTLCSIIGWFSYGLQYQSMMTFAFISYDRYKAIVGALTYAGSATPKKYLMMCGISWIYALTVAAPPLFGWGGYTYQREYFFCHLEWSSKLLTDTLYRIAIGIFLYYPCCIVIVIFYVLVYKTARKLLHSNPEHYNESLPNMTNLSEMKKELKAAKGLFIITTVFCVSYIPFVSLHLASAYVTLNDTAFLISQISQILYNIPHYLNPLVYGYMNTEFKQEFRRLWIARHPVDTIT